MENYNGLKELEKLNLELVKDCWEEYHRHMDDCLKYLGECRGYLAQNESDLKELGEYFGIQKEK